MNHPSRLASVADAVLRTQGTCLAVWLLDHRDRRRTYREMADELSEVTDGMVTVSYEAIRRWTEHYATSDAA